LPEQYRICISKNAEICIYSTGEYQSNDERHPKPVMNYLIKTALVIFMISWTGFGIWILAKYSVLFGPHRDDPAETAGARSLGVAHIASIWFGFFALAFYFLFFK